VGTEGDEAAGLFTLMTAQDALHCTLQVIVAKLLEDAVEITECDLMSFKKRLLCRMRKSPMIGTTAGHRTHLEHLQLHALTTNQCPGFIPINLPFNAPVITLRHERLAGNQPQLLPPALDIAAN